LYIAWNSNPELYPKPDPTPNTASADLYQNKNRSGGVYGVFEMDSIRS